MITYPAKHLHFMTFISYLRKFFVKAQLKEIEGPPDIELMVLLDQDKYDLI